MEEIILGFSYVLVVEISHPLRLLSWIRNDNRFGVCDDGNDYNYQVTAFWEQGYSRYAFRIDNMQSE